MAKRSSLLPLQVVALLFALEVVLVQSAAAVSVPVRASTPSSTTDGGCAVDEDCMLNGICVAGACLCNEGWTGPDCHALNLLPVPPLETTPTTATTNPALQAPMGGIYGVAPNVSSWGGTVLFDGERLHLYVAEMAGGCGLAAWGSHSQIAHATATQLSAPYVRQDYVMRPESHNPVAARGQLGNESVTIWLIGTGSSGPVSPCPSPLQGRRSPLQPSNSPQLVQVATSPEGPWKAVDVGFSCNNPSPMQLPNGTWYVACHNNGLTNLFRSRSASVAGGFDHFMDLPRQPSGSGAWEDPFLYTDVRGNWHILIHAYNLSDNSRMSGHYFSRDGVTWHATGLEPYGFHVAMTNGSTMLTSTRERPKLVLDSSGNVLALINGVSTNYDCKGPTSQCKVGPGTDWTFTLMQLANTTSVRAHLAGDISLASLMAGQNSK